MLDVESVSELDVLMMIIISRLVTCTNVKAV